MPNMDGTGPRWGGMCGGYGCNRHAGNLRGCGNGRGFKRWPDKLSEKEVLAVQKETLKQRLAAIDKRLETL